MRLFKQFKCARGAGGNALAALAANGDSRAVAEFGLDNGGKATANQTQQTFACDLFTGTHAQVTQDALAFVPLDDDQLLLAAGLTSFDVLSYRWLIAGIVLMIYAFCKKKTLRLNSFDEAWKVILLSLLRSITSVTLLIGYANISSGIASTINFMYPVIVTICMMLFFGEKRSAIDFAAIAASIFGVYLLASGDSIVVEGGNTRLGLICSLISAFVIMMYIAIPFGALFKLWGRDYSLSLKWFQQLFRDDGFKAFTDSFVLSLIASPITALLSMIISYLVVKKKFRGKGFIEFVSMLAMAVPGTVLGVGFIRGFAGGVFRTGFLQGIYGTGIILVIVFVVRSLPVGTRSGISALRQIDKSIEESAYDLGAGSAKVFMSVTLPLIKDSFLSGLVTTFVRSITAISAIILLVTPRYLLITCRINEFAEKGAYGVACAYATILIAIVYASIVVMNFVIKHFGTSKYQRVKESD